MSPSMQRAIFFTLASLSLVVATVASATVSAATNNTNTSVEWPYSELLVNFTAEVERCSKVSGFQFRNNSRPNVQQLAKMCADPDCVRVTNNLFKLRGRDQAIFAAAYTAFTVPVLDYCWYMREPGTPCPPDKWSDFLSHVTDKDANCARGTGYSFVNSTGRLENWTLPSGSPCPSDCWPLANRLYNLQTRMPCTLGSRRPYGMAPYTIIVCHESWADDQGPKPSENFQFTYTPGWPLPPTPTTPSPVDVRPPESDASSSGSTDTESTPEAGFPDEEEPTPTSPEVNGLPTLPSHQPTPSAAISLTSFPASREDMQKEEEVITGNSVPVATKKARETATPQGEEELKTRLPRVTTTPEVTASTTTTSDRPLLVVLGASTIGFVLLAAIFFLTKRRRRDSSSKDNGGDFMTMNSPSTAADTTPTDIHWSFDGTKIGLATITKAIPVKHVQDIRIVGTGGYGVVYLVKDTLNNRLLASKRLVDASQASDAMNDAFIREIQLVSSLQHPCIVTFIGATWTNRTDVQALFEYMDGGDLRTYLDTTPVLVPASATHAWTIEKLTIAIDIADALEYVHSTRDRDTPLVHRDLKSRNVLLSKSPRRAKLSDFGVSRELSHNMSMTDGVGTSRWLAPEVILGGGDYGTACDVYSFGVVLSELDTHKLPFWDCGGGGGRASEDMDSMVPEITMLRMVAMEGIQPSFSASCPSKLLELARQCLSHDPADRPTASTAARTLRMLLVQ